MDLEALNPDFPFREAIMDAAGVHLDAIEDETGIRFNFDTSTPHEFSLVAEEKSGARTQLNEAITLAKQLILDVATEAYEQWEKFRSTDASSQEAMKCWAVAAEAESQPQPSTSTLSQEAVECEAVTAEVKSQPQQISNASSQEATECQAVAAEVKSQPQQSIVNRIFKYVTQVLNDGTPSEEQETDVMDIVGRPKSHAWQRGDSL